MEDSSDDDAMLPAEELDEESDAEDINDNEEEASVSSGGPVKLSIKTNMQSAILDQHLEFTASQKRTVASLKQGEFGLESVLC